MKKSRKSFSWLALAVFLVVAYVVVKIFAQPQPPSAFPNEVTLSVLDTAAARFCDGYILLKSPEIAHAFFVMERSIFSIRDESSDSEYWCISDKCYSKNQALHNVVFYVEPLMGSDNQTIILLREVRFRPRQLSSE